MTPPVILLVDDDENDVLLLSHVLNSVTREIRLQAVPNGDAAVDYLSGTGEFADRGRFPLPSLVLTDLNLPRRNGLEVVKWIRAQPSLRTTAVIVFTGFASDGDIARAYELGVNSVLIKPAGAEELTRVLKALHEYWFVLNRLAPAR